MAELVEIGDVSWKGGLDDVGVRESEESTNENESSQDIEAKHV